MRGMAASFWSGIGVSYLLSCLGGRETGRARACSPLLAGQNFLQDPPQFWSVQPCCVMRLLEPGLRQSPLERQESLLLQHHVVAPVSAVPDARQGCWFVSTSPQVL